jgi:tetratricopeptide (TPR) repeat protein
MVHHSNTGHARVFKVVINRRYLSEILGNERSLSIYRDFEKAFERDGFFWQQYGLCQSQQGNYERAVETLEHALAIHDHIQIRHSLGAACLMACAKLGEEGLVENDFGSLRERGRQLLEELHSEVGYREDISIATLVEIDMDISKRFDNSEQFKKLGESYHRRLAFYARDNPEMAEAKRVYEKLSDLLLKASAIEDAKYDELLDLDGEAL